MKNIVSICICLLGLLATGQVKWMSMNEAIVAQKKNPTKKILLKAYTPWCTNCKWMDQNVFSKPKIAAYINENFYPVAFNAEGTETVSYMGKTYLNKEKKYNYRAAHPFANILGISEYPTLVFFDTNGLKIQPIPGKMDGKKLELYLTIMKTDTYKTLTNGQKWAAYQKAFKYQLQ